MSSMCLKYDKKILKLTEKIYSNTESRARFCYVDQLFSNLGLFRDHLGTLKKCTCSAHIPLDSDSVFFG